MIAAILHILIGFILGAFGLLFYIMWRMMRNDGWDDSNMTNALRLISHVALHPEDFGKLYYLDEADLLALEQAEFPPPKRPFWYVSKDELSDVVDSRP